MKVVVSYEQPWVKVTKMRRESLQVEPGTLAALLQRLEERYGAAFSRIVLDPAGGGLRPEIAVLVDGRRVGLESELEDGSEVAFLMPFAGG